MKFSKLTGSTATGLRRWGELSWGLWRQVLVAGVVESALSGLSIGLCGHLLTACQLVTIDYVFRGQFRGQPRAAPTDKSRPTPWTPNPARCATAPRPSPPAASDPVAMAVSADYTNLYVAQRGQQHGSSLCDRRQRRADGEGHGYLERPSDCSRGRLPRHLSLCRFRHDHRDA